MLFLALVLSAAVVALAFNAFSGPTSMMVRTAEGYVEVAL